MIVIATADPDRAKEIGGLVEGRKVYVVKIEDATELRHKIHSWQPEVVILDVRLGGNKFEALHEVPAILEEVKSAPAVIVLLPRESTSARNAAAAYGVFEVFNLRRASWKKELPKAVLEAQAARLAGALERPKKPAPEVLH